MKPPAFAELPAPPSGKAGWPWEESSPSLAGSQLDEDWPGISIVTPSFNQGEYLEETIRSVLLQGYPNLEYRVLDGGSQDGSLEVIRKYAPWLDGWVSEPDWGQSHAINKGWAVSRGEIFAYINSDDLYCPGALFAVARAWRQNPGAAVIVGQVAFTGEDVRGKAQKAPHLSSPSPLDLSLLEPGDWYLPQQATFFIRQKLDEAGRFLREDLHYTMDRELMYRICRLGTVALIPECLAVDRRHAASKRSSQTLAMYREDALAMAYCDWGSREEAARRKTVARHRMAQGYYMAASLSSSPVKSLLGYFMAAWFRPAYLRRRNFYRTLLRAIQRPAQPANQA